MLEFQEWVQFSPIQDIFKIMVWYCLPMITASPPIGDVPEQSHEGTGLGLTHKR